MIEILMALVPLLLLLLLCCQAALTCTTGTIRLNSTASSDSIAGRVEFCYQPSTWESINDDQWDDRDARVACAQLGFPREGATAYRQASNDLSIPVASGRVHVSGFNCSGWESRITRCGYNTSTSGFNYRNDAGIKCLLRKPCRPRNIAISHTGIDYATFSWTSCHGSNVANANGYLVSCANLNRMVSKSSRSQTVHSLRPNKWYTCFVYGVDSLGRLGTGARFTFRTAKRTPSFAPCEFRYTSVSNTSISLAWEPPPADASSGGITHYKLTFCYMPYHSSWNRLVQAPRTQYQESNLLPNQEYSISIKACVNSDCGPSTSSITVVLPATVPRFSVDTATSTDVTLSWQRPGQGIVHYRYYLIYVTNLETNESVTHNISHTNISTTVSSLHPYHRYKFSIAAVFTAATGPFVSRTIRMPEAAPTGGPKDVHCSVVNRTTLSVNWTEPHYLEQNGPIEQYIVLIWNNDAMKFVHSNIQNVPMASVTHVTSLDTYQNYNCSVAGFARGGAGPFTTANVWLTDHANSSTSAPVNLELLMNGPRNASIGWLEPYTRNQNTTIEYYEITIQSRENNAAEFLSQHAQETVHTVTSLHPNHKYTITVKAVTRDSFGPSARINVQALEDVPSEPPQNLQYTKVTTHSVTLTWAPPPLSAQNGAIIGYTIQVFKVDDNTSFSDFQVSKEPSLTVSNLDDDTVYNFSVAGNTSIGAGPYSMHISTKTKSRALEVGIYTGVGLLLVLMAACLTLFVFCYCCRLKLKQCTSKWFSKASMKSINANLSEKEGQNVHRLTDYRRERASNEDDKEKMPELPNRDYLEDIDFVSSEFNLFFKRKQNIAKDQSGNSRNESEGDTKEQIPALPDRRYLQDIDFVSDEFDLFFKRKPGFHARVDSDSKDDNKNGTVKVACSRNVAKSQVTEKPVVGSGHYMALSLKKAQDDPSSASLYQSLQPRKKPTVYENVNPEKGGKSRESVPATFTGRARK